MKPTIRDAVEDDHQAVVDTYNGFVLDHHATFDTKPFTVAERGPWLRQFRTEGPHRLLVAEDGEGILGFAASTPFRPKPAYDATVETTVYVTAPAQGRGVGRMLLSSLVDACDEAGVRLAISVVALPNDVSEALHQSLGYGPVGVLPSAGYKFGRWIDIRLWAREGP